LATDELPFINTKVGGSLVDFEFNVDESTYFSHWHKNTALGQVGKLPIGSNMSLSMMWETGKAIMAKQ
jgi:hypothetical protein